MLLLAARVSKLFGVEGGVILNLYTSFPDDFSTEEPLFAKIDSLAVPLFCDKFERRGQSGATVTFADIDTEKRASEFVGQELYIEAGEERDEEFCMEDLIGFSVTADGMKGIVTDYYDSEANPLFEIETSGKKILIPAADEFFTHIDFGKRRIKMMLPDGLIEIQTQ